MIYQTSRTYCFTSTIMVILSAMLGGCVENGASTTATAQGYTLLHEREPHYSWGFTNASPETIDGVKAIYKQDRQVLEPSAGVLPPSNGQGARWSFGYDPMPDTVILEWRTADGKPHQKTMPVSSQVPNEKSFEGTLWFKYKGGDDWEMIPVTEAEAQLRGEKQLPEVPEDKKGSP